MELTFDLVEQLEDMYRVKGGHLRYLDSRLPESWQGTIPDGYGNAWERREWKFYLKDYRPLPRPLSLLIPDKKQLATWTMIGNANQIIMEVSPESLEEFLDRHVSSPAAKRNLAELFHGEVVSGTGLKAFLSLVVCAREQNRFIDQYLPMMRAFAENDPRIAGVDDELVEEANDFFKEIDDFRRYLESDLFLFKRFAKDLKNLFRTGVTVGILGYGEISSILTLKGESAPRRPSGQGVAFKRMPPFPDRDSVESYRDLFDRYHLLLKKIGLNPPKHGLRTISREDGTITVFATQVRLPEESIGSRVIRRVSREECIRLFDMVLGETLKVARYNRRNPGLLAGIDIQISNWGVDGYDKENPGVTGEETLYYIDTSTPMIREDGRELLDAELFMMSVPPGLRWLVRSLFLQEVLDRYYDTREIVKDLIANFIKEGRKDVVEDLIEHANRFFDEKMPEYGFEYITSREVRKYYRRDRTIWIIFQTARRIDRFIQQKVLRRSYPYRLPDNIGLRAGKPKPEEPAD